MKWKRKTKKFSPLLSLCINNNDDDDNDGLAAVIDTDKDGDKP